MPYRLSGTKLLLNLFHQSLLRLRLLFHDTGRSSSLMPGKDHLGSTVCIKPLADSMAIMHCIEKVKQTEGSSGLKDELRMHAGGLWRVFSTLLRYSRNRYMRHVHTSSTVKKGVRLTSPFLPR
jgi:hypothetical protein